MRMQLGRDDININIYTGVLSKTAESNPAHWDARPGEAAVWSAYSTLSVWVAQRYWGGTGVVRGHAAVCSVFIEISPGNTNRHTDRQTDRQTKQANYSIFI